MNIPSSNKYTFDMGGDIKSKLQTYIESLGNSPVPDRKFVITAGEVGMWGLKRASRIMVNPSKFEPKIAATTFPKGLLMYLSLDTKHGPWKVKVYRNKDLDYHFYYGTKLMFISDKLEGHDLSKYIK